MMGWGCAHAGRGLTLWLLGGVVVAVSVLLWCGCESAKARAAEQGTYCWCVGRRLNQNGDVAGATWSEDGEHWRTP